jgi:hypothetical protein
MILHTSYSLLVRDPVAALAEMPDYPIQQQMKANTRPIGRPIRGFAACSRSARSGGKANCILDWADVADWNEGLIAVLVPDQADDICMHTRRRRSSATPATTVPKSARSA